MTDPTNPPGPPSDEIPAPEPPRESPLVDLVLARVTKRIETQRLPTATYRIQFNHERTFRDATAAVGYFAALGISDLYASPFLKARAGSLHGYDVVDHSQIDPAIGTLDDLRELRRALDAAGLGLITDVVPNHMAASSDENRWWQDVLENGASSPFSAYFDIDWNPLKTDLVDKVLLPVLGDQFGKVLEDSQLQLQYDAGAFWVRYFEHRYPLAPRSYHMILSVLLAELEAQLGTEHDDLNELLSILTSIRNLPARTETSPETLAERRREKEVVKRRLHQLTDRCPVIAEFVARSVALFNGTPGDPRSFDRLDALLQEQAYRLSFWRVASDEINYRRFFDVNDLAAICVELPAVFSATHQLLFQLLDEGLLNGFRIDHPDGLYDPAGYLRNLQEECFGQLCRQELRRLTPAERGPDAGDAAQQDAALETRLRELWRAATQFPGSPLAQPLYVVVEKILAYGEPLPDDWPAHGTVGYDFLNALNRLWVDPQQERTCTAVYATYGAAAEDLDEMIYRCKRQIVRMSMSSELTVLGHRLDRLSERNRWTRDFTLNSLQRSLQEIIAAFSVYRTYVLPGQILERDRQYIEQAVLRAKTRNPALSRVIFNFVRDTLLLRYADNSDERERADQQNFVGKFQQLTGPIMAKSVEDTAFYQYNRLISLNEVGGEPERFGGDVTEFHAFNRQRLPRQAHALNATTTHDTKRSEDVRARIDVLSEIPQIWRERVRRWTRSHRKLKTTTPDGEAPSRNDEYFLYQTLVGCCPDETLDAAGWGAFVERIQNYMQKVTREAKVHSSWISPNAEYETALAEFIQQILSEEQPRPFLAELRSFAATVAGHGHWNSLASVLLKATVPGVPDFFQGTETWNLTLVDPDNRRPIDFLERQAALDALCADMAAALGHADPATAVDAWLAPAQSSESHDESRDGVTQLLTHLLETRRDGRIKLFTTLLALRVRRMLPGLFTAGDYTPLETAGQFQEQVVAFARSTPRARAIIVVPRLSVAVTGFGGPLPLGDVWLDTHVLLPEPWGAAAYTDVFTRRPWSARDRWPCRDLWRDFPLTLLIETPPTGD